MIREAVESDLQEILALYLYLHVRTRQLRAPSADLGTDYPRQKSSSYRLRCRWENRGIVCLRDYSEPDKKCQTICVY